MNAQHIGIQPLINRPALRAIGCGKRVRRVVIVLAVVGMMAQPATAQESIGNAPIPAAVLKHRAFLPVVQREMMPMP